MNAVEENTALVRLIRALQPYRNHLVLVGGWSHRLSRMHPLAQPVDFAPLATQDVDFAIQVEVPPQEEDLRRLLLQEGFKEQFRGEDHPPVTHYELGGEGVFYVEFLTPMLGRAKAATTDIAGVTAQRLRYLDVLMISPWSVLLAEPQYPVGPKPLEIRIANATTYLAQKLLVLNRRRPDERAQDILYVHDSLLTFGRSLDDLQRIWSEVVRPSLHETVARRVEQAAQKAFEEVTDAVRRATRAARGAGRAVETENILMVCRTGLVRIFH